MTLIPSRYLAYLNGAQVAQLAAPDGWRVMFFIGDTAVKGCTEEEMTFEGVRVPGPREAADE